MFTQMSDRLCEMCDQGLYVFPTWECIAEGTCGCGSVPVNRVGFEYALSNVAGHWTVKGDW